MGLISSAGAGSGLDVESIISALVNAERAPVELRLNRQEAQTTTTLTGIGSLSSALSTLKTALEKLDTASDFKVRSTSLSQNGYVTVSPGDAASSTDFSVEVVSLATGSKLESGVIAGGSSATFGAGVLSFGADGKTFSVSVAATDTLTQIRNKINNASDNIGVTATIISTDAGTKLVLNSKITGTGNGLTVTNNNAALDAISTNLVSTQAAADGQIKINGSLVTGSSNTYTTAVADVTITALKNNTAGETTEVSISEDKSAVKKAIEDFVKAYNAAFDEIKKLTSNVEGAEGPLAADSSARSITNRLRNLLTGSVNSVSDTYGSLAAIGIATTRTGTLAIDSTKLDTALSNGLDDIVSLFSADDGLAQRTVDYIDSQIGAGGSLPTRTNTLNKDLDRIATQRESLSLRLGKIETRLRAQYGALDALVAQFSGTSSFIAQNLANLSTSSKK
jgi:flagellar hook-associated protein 2